LIVVRHLQKTTACGSPQHQHLKLLHRKAEMYILDKRHILVVVEIALFLL